tara:strand:- start:5747 stop:6367 length:621 start_codon:yes stop_codon:yes gene_type:complete
VNNSIDYVEFSQQSYTEYELDFQKKGIMIKGTGAYVIMEWERPLMEAIVREMDRANPIEGRDILEVGFGMGMSSDAIQSYNPRSHTIIENHPQIISKVQKWAVQPKRRKKDITIISQDWYEALPDLGTYDLMFWDTYADRNFWDLHKYVDTLAKEGCVLSYWNSNPNKDPLSGQFKNVSYIKTMCSPDKDSRYYLYDEYHIPIVRL